MASAPGEAFISGRRPPFFRFAWRLYLSDDSFRGLVDFAIIGTVVLFFLEPSAMQSVRDLSGWASSRIDSIPDLQRTEHPRSDSGVQPQPAGAPSGSDRSAPKAAVSAPTNETPVAPVPSIAGEREMADHATPPAGAERSVAKSSVDVPMPLAPGLKSQRLTSPPFFVEIDEKALHSSEPGNQPRLEAAAADYRAMRVDEMMDDLSGTNASDPNALFLRALGVMRQIGTNKFAAAHDLLEAATAGGQQQAAVLLGVLLVAGPPGVDKDLSTGKALIETAAAAGDRMAQRAAGIGYISGEFGTLDPVKGAAWLKRAAEAGDAPAMLRYGYLLSTGAGVDQNVTLAEEYVRRAAVAGLTAAQETLGGWILDRYKSGLVTDPTEGIRWLTRAYEAGFSTDALVRLGLFYAQDGRGPWLDRNKSLALFKQCIGYASFSCQFAYANHLQIGLTTPRDLVGAYARYQIARELGAASAQERLQTLDRLLSPDEKTKAIELAKSIREALRPVPAPVVFQYAGVSVKPSPWPMTVPPLRPTALSGPQ